jgi:5-formyltetrahydrofolate cyclo-ligase
MRAACYLNTRTEPPTGPLIDSIIEGGGQVIVPVIDGEDLKWVSCGPGVVVEPGPLGIRQPVGSRLGPQALATIDVAFVPALCVDGRGNRLGRGLGYFDRALAAVQAPVVAIVFDGEYVDKVPVEAHDRPVDAVLMPGGLVSFS